MKALSLALLATTIASVPVYADDTPLKTDKARISYSIGHGMGGNLKKQGVDVDTDMIARGIADALAGTTAAMTQAEMDQTMATLRASIQNRRHAEISASAASNKTDGETFLAKNKTAVGVTTLPSGLQYKVITAGTGNKPKATDKVSVNYRGTTLDGKEFDSSYKRGKPASFPVDGVIPGWTEALQLMQEGAKWQLFIPPNLAYGEQGAGGVIGPNALLVFEVELLKIEKE